MVSDSLFHFPYLISVELISFGTPLFLFASRIYISECLHSVNRHLKEAQHIIPICIRM